MGFAGTAPGLVPDGSPEKVYRSESEFPKNAPEPLLSSVRICATVK
jgi:hypothetical protein